MTLLLPIPPDRYDVEDERERNRLIEAADRENVKRDRSTALPDDVYLGAEIRDRGGAVFNVKHPEFGAVGDGTTSDLAALTSAAAALSPGDTLYIPRGSFRITDVFEIDTDDVQVVCDGEIVVSGNSDYDQAILLSGDNIRAFVRLDQRGNTSHSGRGEGVRVTGEKCLVAGYIWGERPGNIGTNSSGVFVGPTAHDTTLRDLTIEQAGDAAVRHDSAKRLVLDNVWAIDYERKGYSYQSAEDALGSVLVKSFYANTDTNNNESEAFLVDPTSQARRMASCHIVHMEIEGSNQSNALKIEYVDEVVIDYIKADAPDVDAGSSHCLNFDYVYNTLTIGTAVLTAGSLAAGGVQIRENSTADVRINFIRVDSPGHNIRVDASGVCWIGFADLSSADERAIRWGASSGGTLIVEHVRQDSDSASIPCITAFNTSNVVPGRLVVLRRDLVTGTTTVTNVTEVENQIQRNMGQPRVFFADTDPATNSYTTAYLAGDQVWDTAPTASTTPGWICVTAGSPGTWKAMAALSA